MIAERVPPKGLVTLAALLRAGRSLPSRRSARRNGVRIARGDALEHLSELVESWEGQYGVGRLQDEAVLGWLLDPLPTPLPAKLPSLAVRTSAGPKEVSPLKLAARNQDCPSPMLLRAAHAGNHSFLADWRDAVANPTLAVSAILEPDQTAFSMIESAHRTLKMHSDGLFYRTDRMRTGGDEVRNLWDELRHDRGKPTWKVAEPGDDDLPGITAAAVDMILSVGAWEAAYAHYGKSCPAFDWRPIVRLVAFCRDLFEPFSLAMGKHP